MQLFQNENWYLIGAKTSYGAPCDFWETLDYNLSTGDAIVKHTMKRVKAVNPKYNPGQRK